MVPASSGADPSPIALERAVARPLGSPIALPTDRVLHDVDSEGVLWARGSIYKASFDATGATYVPFLGSGAPRNFPVGLALGRVQIGSADIDFAPATPRRAADRIEYDRGTLREVYDVSPLSVEQSFVFDAPLGAGELVLAVDVASELEPCADGAGLVLANDLGGVDITRAVAIDAAGRRLDLDLDLDLDTSWNGSGYSIRVPAEFVASARFPLVIDPTFTTFTVTTTSIDATVPDVSTDPVLGVGAFVVDYAFSATDHDVFLITTASNGGFLGFVTIDPTIEDWRRPSIAFNAASSKFLVVAEVGVSPSRTIRGRTALPGIPAKRWSTTRKGCSSADCRSWRLCRRRCWSSRGG